ncbi:MAG: MATE family efflux transporter [bacterium]
MTPQALTEGASSGPWCGWPFPSPSATCSTCSPWSSIACGSGRWGREALAALGTANAAVMIFMTVSMGMSVGTLAGVARATGAGRRPAARFFQQGMLLAWALGVVFLVASWPARSTSSAS